MVQPSCFIDCVDHCAQFSQSDFYLTVIRAANLVKRPQGSSNPPTPLPIAKNYGDGGRIVYFNALFSATEELTRFFLIALKTKKKTMKIMKFSANEENQK